MDVNDSVITLTLTGMAQGGAAFGRHAGKMVFAYYALPGEEVRVEVTDDRGKYAFARLLEVLRPAPERIAPRCAHFGVCGGCQWQHAAYAAQLRYKQAIVVDQLTRIGGLQAPRVLPTVPSPQEWHYRNHVRFVPVAVPAETGDEAPPELALGFHALESHDVVPIRECHIIDPALADLHASLDIDPEGFAAVQLRAGVRAGEAMLVFETEDEAPPEIEVDLPVSAALLLPDGEAATLIGETVLVEEVRGRAFRVSPGSFFQVNTPVADLLVERVLGYLAPQGGETVLDAYCGVGLFSAFCAPHCARLIGIEASAGACADFAANLDEFDNVELYQGMVEYVLPELVAGGLRADAAVLDPPRAGCAPEVLQAFVDAGVKRLVYVSCDIATLARDIKRLTALGYRLVEALPVDMFPQTYHTEVVACLVQEQKG